MDPPSYYHDIQQGTPEWDDARRGIITASAVKILVTPTGKPANNDTSRAYLYQLLAERLTGKTESGFYSDDMARGHLLEPFARDLYSQHYAPVQECGFIDRNLGDNVVLGYSPDGLVGDDGLIEIKSRLAKHHLATMVTCKVPSEFQIQLQTGLLVSGRKWIDYISYTPGLPLYRHRVERDDDMCEKIASAVIAAEATLRELFFEYRSSALRCFDTKPIQLDQQEIIC